jgi:methanogenic corrinoid protein MtbC1
LKILDVAIKYNAEGIFQDYALWLIKLLFSRMKDISSDRIREQMINHYQIIAEVIEKEFDQNYYEKAQIHLKNAINITKDVDLEKKTSQETTFENSDESELRKLQFQYLNSLLRTDKYQAQKVVEKALNLDIPLEMIYLEIFQKSLIKVGELWNSNEITVDAEHYITSMTQNIMMQFWPRILETEKNGLSLLACSIGNELHEMGVRILCDLMEIKGWNSIYLGAAVPVENILNALEKHKPDLVVLSVTMPFYLEQCEEAVKKIKANKEFKDVKVAVGGRAFSIAPHISKNWGVDVTADTASELAEWVQENI